MGWETRQLASICEVFADGDWIESKDQSETGVRLIQTGNVGEGVFKDRAEKARYVSVETFKRLRCTEIFPGDCLISRLPDPVGRACIIPDTGESMITAVDCTIVRFRSGVYLPEFFTYYSQSVDYLSAVDAETTGTTRKRISRARLGQVAVPVPPLPEQRRIVAILDEAFEAIATAKANTEKNLQNGRAVFNGLLNSMFASSEWQRTTIGELFRVGSSKRVLKSQWQPQGIPFYRGREITRLAKDGFVDNELHISEELYAELSSQYGVPDAGDIMVTAIGTIGNAYVVRQGDQFYFKDASVLWLKKTTDVSSEFINYWLRSNQFFEQLDRGNGATVDTLTIQKLQSVALKLPSLSEQRRIVMKLDAFADSAERLEELNGRKLTALDELKKSLLHQAFAGQLTAESTDQQLEAVA